MCKPYEEEETQPDVELAEAMLMLKEEIHCLRYDVGKVLTALEGLVPKQENK